MIPIGVRLSGVDEILRLTPGGEPLQLFPRVGVGMFVEVQIVQVSCEPPQVLVIRSQAEMLGLTDHGRCDHERMMALIGVLHVRLQ